MAAPVWLKDLAFHVANKWCHLAFGTDFLDRRCRRCGERRYNHAHGRTRGCKG